MTTKIITTAPATNDQECALSMYNWLKSAFAAHGWWTVIQDTYDGNLVFDLKFTNNTQLIDWEPITLNFHTLYQARWVYPWYYPLIQVPQSPVLNVWFDFSDWEINNQIYNNGYNFGNSQIFSLDPSYFDSGYLGWLWWSSWKIQVSDRYAILIANSNDDNRQAWIYAVWDLVNYFNTQWLTWRQKLITLVAWTWSSLDQNQCSKIVRYGYDENGNKTTISIRIINNNDNVQKNVNVERWSQELLTPAMLNMKDNIGYLGELLPWVIFKIQQPTSYIWIHGSEGIVSGHTYKRALDTNAGTVGRLAVRWEESV